MLGDRVRSPGRGVVVLIYHRVGGGTAIEVDLPASLFDEQMAWLAEHAHGVSIDDAVDRLERSDDPPPAPQRPRARGRGHLRRRHRRPGRRRPADPGAPRRPGRLLRRRPTSSSGACPFPNDGRPMSWAGAARGDRAPAWSPSGRTPTPMPCSTGSTPRPRRPTSSTGRAELIADRLGRDRRPLRLPQGAARDAGGRGAGPRAVPLGGSGRQPGQPATAAPTPTGWPGRRSSAATAMRFFERKATGGMALEEDARRALNRVRYWRRSA